MERHGSSIGFSPASSFREHVSVYKLPTVEFDYINFTGMEYVGRDIHLVRSSDAVITVGGRMGSLHELSTGLESRKVCGVLLGSGGLADYVPTLLEHIEAPGAKDVIYDTDPDRLVTRVIEALDRKYADFQHDGTDKHLSLKRSGQGWFWSRVSNLKNPTFPKGTQSEEQPKFFPVVEPEKDVARNGVLREGWFF